MKYIGFDYWAFSWTLMIFASIDMIFLTSFLSAAFVLGSAIGAFVIGSIKETAEYRKNHESEVP